MIARTKNLILLITISLVYATINEPVQATESKTWINLCIEHNEKYKTTLTFPYLDPQGGNLKVLVNNQQLDGCDSAVLPVNIQQVNWLRLINHDLAKRIDKTIILQGVQTENELTVSEIILLPEKSSKINKKPLTSLPINRNLVPDFSFLPFGSEQRASVEHNGDSIVLFCNTGDKHAGLKMHIRNARLPQGIKPHLSLNYRSTQAFSISISDALRNQNENPLHIKDLKVAQHLRQKKINIPYPKIDSKTEISWSLHCPSGEAQFTLASLQLEAPPSKKETIRGIWVWGPNAWINTPHRLLEKIKSANAKEVYISIPVNLITNKIPKQNALATFINNAFMENISVWAVEGDPHAVIKDQRTIFIQRAKIYAAYNSRIKKESRLKGIQYDIEPYLMPGYALDESLWITAYVQTVTALSQASSLPIDIVIPFWWNKQQHQGKYFLDKLAPYIERVTVMNYRTDTNQLRKFAEPFLTWGDNQKRKIRIAIELGPIKDELRWHYQPSDSGQLWLLQIKNQYLLLLLNTARINPYGKQYKFVRSSTALGKNISFYNDLDKLLHILPELENNWMPYRFYDGLSLHGL